jgi:general secretion pathway protein K
MSRSAYTGALKLITMSENNYDSLQDQWALELPPYHFEDEQVFLRVKIEDQERFFNPKMIMKEKDTVDEKHLKQFRNLLEVLVVDPDLSNAFLDWIDTDTQRRLPLGADGLDYDMDMPAKGGNFDSLEEILHVKGVTEDMYRGRLVSGREVHGLKDVLSIYGADRININTAGVDILRSLDDEFTEEMALELIRRREEKPFQSMDDLLDLPGMNHDLLYRVKELADVKSENFKITLTVENYNKESSDLVVVVNRSGQSGKIIYWQAD